MALHTLDKLDLVCLPEITLSSGTHSGRAEGVCVLEAAAWLAGEPHTDHPSCVSPAIAAFCRRWNDDLPDDATRDRLLKPLLPVLLDTRTSGADETTRAWMALDWLVRTHTPAWFDLVSTLSEAGAALRNLPALTNAATARGAQPAIRAARDATRAATWAAARDGAWAAARDATRAAAGDALAPTTARLQDSAVALVRSLCAVGR